MKLFQVLSLTALAALVLAACNSGNRRMIAGHQCPAGWAPFDMKAAEKAQKTWNKGDNESSIPAGTYIYVQSDLIFTQKGENGAIVHLVDSAPRGGVFKTTVYCVRNGLHLSKDNLSASMNAVSKMVATAGQALDLEAKELSFKVVDGRLVAASNPVPKPTSLEKVYEGKSSQLFMLPTLGVDNKIDYEIRSSYEDNVGTYVVSVKFKRVNNP